MNTDTITLRVAGHFIDIKTCGSITELTSNLKDRGAPEAFNASMDAIESLTLALHQAGVDVAGPAVSQALETTLEAISQRYDDVEPDPLPSPFSVRQLSALKAALLYWQMAGAPVTDPRIKSLATNDGGVLMLSSTELDNLRGRLSDLDEGAQALSEWIPHPEEA